MIFHIAKKRVVTDWYEIEAENQEQAMQLFNENQDKLVATQRVKGWSFSDLYETYIHVVEKPNDQTK